MSARCWGRCWRWRRARTCPRRRARSAARSPRRSACWSASGVRNEVRALDQTARGALRKLGVRFGSLYIYVPALLKPGAARALLAACGRCGAAPRPAPTGCWRSPRRGAPRSPTRGCCRPTPIASPGSGCAASAWCGSTSSSACPTSSARRFPITCARARARRRRPTAFVVTPQMTSLTGCSGEAFASILRSLGFEPIKVSKAAFEAARPQSADGAAEAGRQRCRGRADARRCRGVRRRADLPWPMRALWLRPIAETS